MTTEKMTKELFDALEALCLMWNQYCEKPTGHLFMTAGEECMEILERHKLLISKDDINGEIDQSKLEEYREQVTPFIMDKIKRNRSVDKDSEDVIDYEIEKRKYFAEMKAKQEKLYMTPKERDTPDLLKLTFELSARAAMQPHNQLMHDFYTEARVELESRLFENAGQQVKGEGDRACPCLYLDEPCNESCTCKNGISSFGCLYCSSYGSIEQRKNKALFISAKFRESDKEEGWISCAERLPESGERVYAYDSDWGGQFVAYLNIANVWKMASDSSPINRNITHWHKLLSTQSLPFASKPTTNAQ